MHLPLTASVPDDIYLCIFLFHLSSCLCFHGSLGQVKTLLSKPLSHELLYLQSQQLPDFIIWHCYVLFSAELTVIVSLKGLQVLKLWYFKTKLGMTFRICWFCQPSFFSFIIIISKSHLLLVVGTEVGSTVGTFN